MRYRYEPTPEAIAQVRDDLKPFIHDPAAYWHELAEMLIGFGLLLRDAHQAECHLADCRTCVELVRLPLILGAHEAIQPTGCACPKHLVYPAPPASGQ